MSTLTSKQISKTYKQLLKLNVSANTGVTGDLQNVQSGDGTNSGQAVYFQYDNHTSGDTYTWDFIKNATGGKIYACAISTSNTFPASSQTSLSGFTSAAAGSQNISRTITFTTSTIYIGFLLTTTSTDTLEVQDLIVTKS